MNAEHMLRNWAMRMLQDSMPDADQYDGRFLHNSAPCDNAEHGPHHSPWPANCCRQLIMSQLQQSLLQTGKSKPQRLAAI
jgi:hypothetical protein